MSQTEVLKAVAAFALAVTVVAAGAAGAGTLLAEPTPKTDVDAPAYNTELLPSAVTDNGSVDAPGGETKTVVVDQSHGNGIGETQMQPLVDALVRGGHEVRFHVGSQTTGLGSVPSGSSSSLNETLQSADAFVVANPATTYTATEIRGIQAFAEAGGRVLLLADPVNSPTGDSSSLPIPGTTGATGTTTPGQPTNLAGSFGISFGAGYLFDMTDNANNFQRVYATSAGSAALTDGIERVVLDDATPLVAPENATRLVQSQDVQLSSTRRTGTYTAALRTGNVVAVGDTNFLDPASATVADNDIFVTNIAAFLVNGDKEPGVPASSSPGAGSGGFTPPTQPGTTTPAGNATASTTSAPEVRTSATESS
jgi:hypothetical protein